MLVIISEDKMLLNRILNTNILKPKCATVCDILLNFLINNSFKVVKNRKKAAETKTVWKSKSVDKFLIKKNVNITEIINVIIKKVFNLYFFRYLKTHNNLWKGIKKFVLLI